MAFNLKNKGYSIFFIISFIVNIFTGIGLYFSPSGRAV